MNTDEIGYLKDFPSFEQEGFPLCTQVDPDMFFPIETFNGALRSTETYLHEKEVKQICAKCPLKLACAEYALKDPDIQGIWGGLTWSDRKSLRRRLRSRKKLEML